VSEVHSITPAALRQLTLQILNFFSYTCAFPPFPVTVPELATRNPANLYAKLVEVQDVKQLVRKMP
jgi:hypothetical protein